MLHDVSMIAVCGRRDCETTSRLPTAWDLEMFV